MTIGNLLGRKIWGKKMKVGSREITVRSSAVLFFAPDVFA
jgi:hypothetical protein